MNYKTLRRFCLSAAVMIGIGVGIMRVFFTAGNDKSGKVTKGPVPVSNPLKGWAAWGETPQEADDDVTLAYIPVLWSEAEPQKGQYAFDELERAYHFSEWRKRGVRLILRVISDNPQEESHMDIPRWLYQEMGEDGEWYDTSYGKGFSPNYNNHVLQEAHGRLLDALGKRYGQNPQIAYIQLGSLGHWGEWHVNNDEGISSFPRTGVTDGYVEDYIRAFPGKKLLMRRPYEIARDNGIGLYNDSFGKESAMQSFASWIADGYRSDQNLERHPGMRNFWINAPSGGEFASGDSMQKCLTDSMTKTEEWIRENHITFLGPHAPANSRELSETEANNSDILSGMMGYCLRIKYYRIRHLRDEKDLELELVWDNEGVAPLYENWDVRILIRDKQGTTVWEQDKKTVCSDWAPGEHGWNAVLKGTAKLPPGTYGVYAGIVDPLTGACAVRLAMNGEGPDMMYPVAAEIKVKKKPQ